MTAIDRFLRYVTYDTQSDEHSDAIPSTAKQKAVAQDARAGKNTAEAEIMDAEVKKLESQIAEMKKHNQKLANISVRMAV